MARSAAGTLSTHDQALYWARQSAMVIGASLFVALCARVTLPLPFTPVPLTMQNFAVLLVGLTLGSRGGFAALMLYLLEGVSGMPVFNPLGGGGIAQLFGPTGGFLLAYPFVAGIAGWIMERTRKTFFNAVVAGLAGEIILFAGGVGWLFVLTHSFVQALRFGLYWFVFAEIIKVMFAAALATGWKRFFRVHA